MMLMDAGEISAASTIQVRGSILSNADGLELA